MTNLQDRIQAAGPPPPPPDPGDNDNFADAVSIGMGDTLTGSNVGATAEASEELDCNGDTPNGVWWTFAPAVDVNVAVVSLTGSDFDTVLDVFTGSAPGSLTVVTCNDDADSSQSRAWFRARGGTVYRIRVGGYGGTDEGNISISLSQTRYPTYIELPSDVGAIALGISPNGSVIVGGEGSGLYEPVRWDAQVHSAMDATGAVGPAGRVADVNDAGIAVGADASSVPLKWMPERTELEVEGAALGINASSTICGSVPTGPCTWDSAGVRTDLASVSDSAQALGIADDGRCVGFDGADAVTWDPDGTKHVLDLLSASEGAQAQARGISPDGTIICGYASGDDLNDHAVTWDPATFAVTQLDLDPPLGFSHAYGINDAGQAVGRTSDEFFNNVPVLFEAGTSELLPYPGSAAIANDISSNGTIVGEGTALLWLPELDVDVGEFVDCLDLPTPFARTPQVNARVKIGGESRSLNGSTADAVMRAAKWASEVNGGYKDASFEIPLGEYVDHRDIYRYGADVVLTIADTDGYGVAQADAGAVVFKGYINEPATASSADHKLITAVGYQTLLRERKEPFLWQFWHSREWQPTDGPPFGGYFRNNDAIIVNGGAAQIGFQVPKGQDVNDGDTGRSGIYEDDDVLFTRVAGTISKNQDMPGSGDAWQLHLYRYDSPSDPGSEQNVSIDHPSDTTLTPALYDGNNDTDFRTVLGQPRPALTLTLERTGGDVTTSRTAKFWVRNLRTNGNAYQSGRTPDDSYATHFAAMDMAEAIGIANVTDMVQTDTQNCLPLYNQPGKFWSDTLDHLTLLLTGGHGWKWGIWESPDDADLLALEFRDYDTAHNNAWLTSAYSPGAMSKADIDQIQDDLYWKVMVTYHIVGHHRLHRKSALVDPNPFAGLDEPLASRRRVRHIHIPEPLPPGATLPQEIADRLAVYYSLTQYGGTITTVSVADTDGNARWAGQVRAGELINVCDFPNPDGTTGHTFRILSVEGVDEGPCTISIGRLPNTLPGIMARIHARNREHALHHQHH